ncbi:hypothetical protein N0V83_005782 [Neocucurbitaria cava]|uniref:Uncharacterized protein n=1 Tax=Neocucurbitaria cava TaxID=798079 RepID=A0A9W8Y7G6_9PLEO|nr:hypothetical protein N0V83_005782 [Neocucurbitaria cava]
MAEVEPRPITSVLCSDFWTWDPDEECTVKFNEDGTGELLCSVEFNVFIASQFDWEIRSKGENVDINLPVTIDVAITLTKRELKDDPPPIAHTALSDAAFVQKEYQLQLEKGTFKVENRTTYGFNPTYEYKLNWDKAPYPLLEEWNNKQAAKAGRYWERKDFYKGQIEDSG